MQRPRWKITGPAVQAWPVSKGTTPPSVAARPQDGTDAGAKCNVVRPQTDSARHSAIYGTHCGSSPASPAGSVLESRPCAAIPAASPALSHRPAGAAALSASPSRAYPAGVLTLQTSCAFPASLKSQWSSLPQGSTESKALHPNPLLANRPAELASQLFALGCHGSLFVENPIQTRKPTHALPPRTSRHHPKSHRHPFPWKPSA